MKELQKVNFLFYKIAFVCMFVRNTHHIQVKLASYVECVA